tara:strand:- start:72 stop:536 length:465 start_codon:yes stop_codon:yes gene_type:complete
MARIIETLADGSPLPSYLTQSRRNITVNPVRTTVLSRVGEHKFFCYSGVVVGDVTLPATISLISIADTGQDSHMEFQGFYARPIGLAVGDTLGLEIQINNVTVYKSQGTDYRPPVFKDDISFFVPRQSKLEVLSLNTNNNNTQERGCNIIGEYI